VKIIEIALLVTAGAILASFFNGSSPFGYTIDPAIAVGATVAIALVSAANI
jgi:preprotein translocase subunit Sec61beta